MKESVLNLVYPPESIFVADWEFDVAMPAASVTCRVPPGIAYTLKPIPYVTAENYVRCLSQSCYLLAEHVLERKLISLDLDVDAFREAARTYELYYRSLSMVFHARVAPGVEFPMRLVLKNWREIRRLHDFVLFTFTNERTVISGEMSFVYAGKL